MFFMGDVGLDLWSFARQFRNVMRKVYETAATPELTARETQLLFHIVRTPSVQADIARELSWDTGLVNRRVKRLIKKGFITLKSDGPRRKLLRSTPEGLQASAEAKSREEQAVNQVLASMSPPELYELYEAAARLGEHRYDPDVHNVIDYRDVRPGEMAYVLESIVGVYDEPNDYDFDETFEAYVLELLAAVVVSYQDPGNFVRIAKMRGRVVGSIICGSTKEGVIEFQLLTERYGYMNRDIGSNLIAQAVTQARSLGFKKAIATTYDGISGSQPYQNTNWKPAESKMEEAFGKMIKNRTWTLNL